MTLNFADFYWGADSAEQDKELLHYFIENNGYNNLIKKRKSLITGRKGSGKSALRKKIKNELENELTIDILPDDRLLRENIDLPSDIDIDKEIVFKQLWLKYFYEVIITEIVRLESLNSLKDKMSKRYIETPEYKKAINYIKDYESSLDTGIESIKDQFTHLLKNIKVGIPDAAIYSFENDFIKVFNNDNLKQHLKAIVDLGLKINLCIDDLDQGWQNNEPANKLLIGLLLACEEFKQLAGNGNCHYFLFLRYDMYEILMSNSTHSDKFRDIYSITWTPEALYLLLVERIKFNCKEQNVSLGLLTQEGIFNLVFPDKVGQTTTSKWLVDRTLNRPRELVQLVRLYTEQSDSPSPENIKKIESRYSNWKLQDLYTEYQKIYPNLQLVFNELKKHLQGKNNLYKFEDFNKILNDVVNEIDVLSEDKTNEQVLLEILYEIDFIGDFIRGGEGGGTTVVFKSSAENHSPTFKEVQIHPCFRKAMDIKTRNR